ncbi:hypothetical protein C5167_006209 [Papaver somniferum]|uniref:Uncharacterized protein n=1 Tax=Papaver somniferum TaxID=3469 RepID=A0A4Y7JGY1_PAPSO|nr:hypothetical protein C5167_006209 [Papaver somniferum]
MDSSAPVVTMDVDQSIPASTPATVMLLVHRNVILIQKLVSGLCEEGLREIMLKRLRQVLLGRTSGIIYPIGVFTYTLAEEYLDFAY